MSIATTIFQVKVKIGQKLRSFHYIKGVDANSLSHARIRAGKHGRVVSSQKVDAQELLGNIEKMPLEEVSIGDVIGGKYDNLGIDELLGLRKTASTSKRKFKGKYNIMEGNKRRSNNGREPRQKDY